jgi:hypothetical protein
MRRRNRQAPATAGRVTACRVVLAITVALGAGACSLAGPHADVAATPGKDGIVLGDGGLPVAATRGLPAAGGSAPVVSVMAAGSVSTITAKFAERLFASAPVVVVATEGTAQVKAGISAATAEHAPLLLVPGPGTSGAPGKPAAPKANPRPVNAGLLTAIRGLHPRDVLDLGLPSASFTAGLPGVSVATTGGQLPATGAPAPLHGLAVLIPATMATALAGALTVTAHAAGATVVPVRGDGDPRADPSAIATLARVRPRDVVAIGGEFGPVVRLESRLAVAVSGVQLPGGGQVLFPGRRLVALYGHPGTPALGVLGQQDLTASVARARQFAAQYQPLSSVPVVPAFEVIASVAEGSPGPDGSYSYETPVADVRAWVQAATRAGLYVVLDLQPGRASLLAQAEQYQSLLELPSVGLALDAEWKLQPGQKPLKQIGHVDISEVNSVISWLAGLTQQHRLPQKLLVLHQFQLQMIRDEGGLDTSRDDLSILVHMDGQGTPGDKQATWDAVTAAAPSRVFFGWKNFLVKDHPTLTPSQTMTKTPTPVMISYQ